MVTLLHLLIWFALMRLVMSLSDYGRFFQAMARQAQENIEILARFGHMPVFELPILELTPLGHFFIIVPWLFLWVMDLGYLYYVRGTVRGDTLGYRSLFEGFNYFFKAVLIRFVHALIVGFGLLLFIAPGIILLCGFSQVNLLLLDHPDKNVCWLFRESWRLMRGRKGAYFTLVISFIGWYLLTEIPLISLIARLWYIPYFTTTRVCYYESITGRGPAAEAAWQRPGMF